MVTFSQHSDFCVCYQSSEGGKSGDGRGVGPHLEELIATPIWKLCGTGARKRIVCKHLSSCTMSPAHHHSSDSGNPASKIHLQLGL